MTSSCIEMSYLDTILLYWNICSVSLLDSRRIKLLQFIYQQNFLIRNANVSVENLVVFRIAVTAICNFIRNGMVYTLFRHPHILYSKNVLYFSVSVFICQFNFRDFLEYRLLIQSQIKIRLYIFDFPFHISQTTYRFYQVMNLN